jgi:ClpP class serine protease
MTTRKGKIKDIDQVARGRVFIADQALKLGMVDEIGGAGEAVTYAADRVHLKAEDYDVRVIPAPKTLADYINGTDEDTRTPIQSGIGLMDSPVLKLMSPSMRSMVAEQLEIMWLLQQRPVVLAAPFAFRVN